LNRAAAAGIISLALAVILVALVLSFRREVGKTLIRLGRQLAGEQQPPPASQAQNPSNSAASPVRNDPAPASLPASNPSPSSSGQLSVSTAQSQPATSPIQTPDVTPQSTPDRASTIQQIEDLPAPEGGGSGQREFDQAKTILKGIHRQRDIQMAVTLLWTGVRKGYVPAEVTLADLYARGDGVQRSCEQARVLLKAAIQKGSPEGRRRLVLLTQQGCAGS
jgi:TPR repeat protein